jgi:ATP-dependent DNA helicase RecG
MNTKESQLIEWKESWRDEYLKWICGFANAEGGTLIIGKADDGSIKGIDNAPKLLEDIPNKVRDILGIIVDVNLVTYEDRETIEIVVESYPYPISYKGEYHYRTGSTKQELKGAALDRFLLRKQGKTWDGVPVPHVGIADLDHRLFETFRKKAYKSGRLSEEALGDSDKHLLDKLLLCEGEYLKRSAILLFHPEPQRFFTGAYIKIGFFKTDSELLYQDVIEGDLFTQAQMCFDLLQTKYLKAHISYEGQQRIEQYDYAPSALREALHNAIVHKDYASGVPIQISVYEDKLMFWNPGQLPEYWTVDTLKDKHPSRPFNPDVANAFFRAGFIESWGRGIEKIITESQRYNATTPQFRYDGGLWLSFQAPVIAEEKTSITQVTPQVTPQVQKLIEIMQGEMSRSELMDALGLQDREHFRKEYLSPAIDLKVIELTIPDKPTSSKQKYRLKPMSEK